MGVTVSDCDGKTPVEVLLRQSDAGLYAAKEKGRNRTEHLTRTAKKTATGRARKS
jgi:PleD family two-component response regulator